MPTFLSVDEAFQLLDAQGEKSALDLRSRAMMELFYSSGLRLSELAGLDVIDIDFNQELIKYGERVKKKE